jgi:hypothetical protein
MGNLLVEQRFGQACAFAGRVALDGRRGHDFKKRAPLDVGQPAGQGKDHQRTPLHELQQLQHKGATHRRPHQTA